MDILSFCKILSELSCNQISMETKGVILARFVDFDDTLTNVLPWQPDVRLSKKICFHLNILKNLFWQLVGSVLHFL